MPSRAAAAGPGPSPAAAGTSAAGTLYVVATPIGNLADVTLRAIEVLRAAPLIAAEDTRVTRRLLARHGIDSRLVSFHARSGPGRLRELLDHLRAGRDLAVVTDAGTPGISDPGEELVDAWAAEGGRVVPVPGASAVLAALAASGIAGPRWAFEGFLPRSGRERRERVARIAGDDRATILFEAPTRLAATLRDLAAACGAERRAAVCRELTKLHEQVVRGGLGELADAAGTDRIPALGEVVVVVAGRPLRAPIPFSTGADANASARAIAAARAEVQALVGGGMARTEAARSVAHRTGIPRRILYAREEG